MGLKNRKKLRRSRNRRDASESLYVANQLEQTIVRTYEQRLPEFKARTLIPVNNEQDDALEVIKYRTYDAVGSAKIIASYADDLPRADVKGQDYTAEVRSLGSAYGYNLKESRIARKTGSGLPQRKANAAKRAIEQEIDRIARAGDADNGLLGLLNQPNALIMVVPNGGTSGTPLWADKEDDEILADLDNLAANSFVNTNEVERADTILLPLSSYREVAMRRLEGTTTTLLQFFRQTNAETDYPIRRITSWTDLETAGSGGTRRAVAYRNDPDAIEMRIPLEFEQLEPEKRNLEWVVDCHAMTGGVLAFFPFTITYADGI